MCKAERFLSGDDMMAVATAIYNANFKGQGVCERDDLIGEGVYGLIMAGERYDSGKGQFLTYAWKCACRKMLSFFNREKKMQCVSLDEIVCDEVRLVEMIDSGVDVEELIFRDNAKEQVAKLKGCCGGKIARDIVGGKRQREIAEDYGLTRQRVSQVFCNFKEDVRKKYDYIDGEICEKELTR